MRIRAILAALLVIALAGWGAGPALAGHHESSPAAGSNAGAGSQAQALAQVIADLESIQADLELSAEVEARIGQVVADLQAAARAEAGVQAEALVAAAAELSELYADLEGNTVAQERVGAAISVLADLSLMAGLELLPVTVELMGQLEAAAGQDAGQDQGQGQGQGAGQGSGQTGDTGGGIDLGQLNRLEAALKVSNKLSAVLAEGKMNESALANIQLVMDRLTAEAAAQGLTEAEAMAAVEADLEAKAAQGSATAGELDVLAHVQAAQGKRAEALATMKARLQANPHTQQAYEVTVELAVQQGEHQAFDTFVNGSQVAFDVRPKVQEGRTLMPIRAIAESLGAEVQWDAETQTVTISKDGNTIVLTIGSQVALVNGEEVQLDVAAQIDGGRTLLPARFVSENLGLYVSFLAQSKTIIITEQPLEESHS